MVDVTSCWNSRIAMYRRIRPPALIDSQAIGEMLIIATSFSSIVPQVRASVITTEVANGSPPMYLRSISPTQVAGKTWRHRGAGPTLLGPIYCALRTHPQGATNAEAKFQGPHCRAKIAQKIGTVEVDMGTTSWRAPLTTSTRCARWSAWGKSLLGAMLERPFAEQKVRCYRGA